jgi:hypothetical protein
MSAFSDRATPREASLNARCRACAVAVIVWCAVRRIRYNAPTISTIQSKADKTGNGVMPSMKFTMVTPLS